jgi:hypothetical protein
VTGRWFEKSQPLLRSKCIGIDFAFTSAISRGALTAVFWIARPPVPWEIHAETRAALAKALERKGLTNERDVAQMTRSVLRATR